MKSSHKKVLLIYIQSENYNSTVIILLYLFLYILFSSIFNFNKQVFPSPSKGIVMAQPAVPVNEDRTDLLRVPPFWARSSVNPPFIWENGVGQFFLAISLQDNISLGEVLVAPAELVDEPYPKPEAPGIDENAADVASKTVRIAKSPTDECNEERRRKSPRIGHKWYYHEAEARLKSRHSF